MNDKVPSIDYTVGYAPTRNQFVDYVPPDSYLERFKQERKDCTKTIPFQAVESFPRSGNEGLFGWTYKNKDGKIRVREDLTWGKRIETDIHESIHTSDEYETRVVTWSIMGSMFERRKKYSKEPKEYLR